MKSLLFMTVLALSSISNAANYICSVGAQKGEDGTFELVSQKTVQLSAGKYEVLHTQGTLTYAVWEADNYEKDTKKVLYQSVNLSIYDSARVISPRAYISTGTKTGQQLELTDEVNNVFVVCIPQ